MKQRETVWGLATNQKVARSNRAGRTKYCNKLRGLEWPPFLFVPPFVPLLKAFSVSCLLLPDQVPHD